MFQYFTNPITHSSPVLSSLHITFPQLWCSNSKPLNLSALSAFSPDLHRSLLTPFQGASTTGFSRMPNQGKPKGRPTDHFVIQYQKPEPFVRGSVIRIRTTRISKFKNYEELVLYLLENCGGGHRIFPGGADFPVITYNKYKDKDTVERKLKTEPWKRFAASVQYIFIKRVEA